jgi:hypothetical protein
MINHILIPYSLFLLLSCCRQETWVDVGVLEHPMYDTYMLKPRLICPFRDLTILSHSKYNSPKEISQWASSGLATIDSPTTCK